MNPRPTATWSPRLTSTILAPVAGPFLQAWIEARRADPWTSGNSWADKRNAVAAVTFLNPRRTSVYEVRAGEFYDLYAAAAEEAGLTPWSGRVRRVGNAEEPLLSPRDFGLVLQALGFEPDRDEDGRYYTGLTMLTREERAAQDAERAIAALGHKAPAVEAIHAAALDRHMAEFDHGMTTKVWEGTEDTYEAPNPCKHSHTDILTAEDHAALAAAEREYVTGQAEAVARIRARYEGYARWRVGDPDPDPMYKAA